MSTITKAAIPFRWDVPLTLQFEAGTASAIELVDRLDNPESFAATFASADALPGGVTLAASGRMSYDGAGAVAQGEATLTATSADLVATTTGTVAITAAPLPADPQGLTATAPSSAQVNLAWTAGAGGATVTRFDVGRSLTGTGGWTNIYAALGTSTTDSTVTAGTQYFYRVRAWAGSVGSASYATASVTVPAVGSEPADFIIPANVSSWNAAVSQPRASGGSAVPNSVAGAVIELSAGTSTTIATAGTRGPLVIQGLAGTSGSRKTVRNPSGGAVTISGSDTFNFEIASCSHVNFVFSNGGQTYGLVVECATSSSNVNSLIKFRGRNHNLTLSHFDLDGKRTSFVSAAMPIGFSMHDMMQLRASNPGVFQTENVIVERFRIRRVSGEGIYGGPNFSSGASPLRNITIRHGDISDTGRDAIQVKCWFEGTNAVHGITATNVGRNTTDEAGQRFGISIMSGQADVYDCRIENSGESGIQLYTQNGPDAGVTFNGFGQYSAFVDRVYNNLIIGAGQIDTGTVNTGHGITVGADSAARVEHTAYCYNNTIVDSEGAGISVGTNAGAGWLRNNVLLNNAGGAYSLGSGGTTQANNKTSGSLTAAYRLTAEDAAVGTPGTDIAETDLDGVSRAGTASKGCYEYA